jgi:hypothetical protein
LTKQQCVEYMMKNSLQSCHFTIPSGAVLRLNVFDNHGMTSIGERIVKYASGYDFTTLYNLDPTGTVMSERSDWMIDNRI